MLTALDSVEYREKQTVCFYYDVYFFYTDYSVKDCVPDPSEVMNIKEVDSVELLHLIEESPFKSDEYLSIIKKELSDIIWYAARNFLRAA